MSKGTDYRALWYTGLISTHRDTYECCKTSKHVLETAVRGMLIHRTLPLSLLSQELNLAQSCGRHVFGLYRCYGCSKSMSDSEPCWARCWEFGDWNIYQKLLSIHFTENFKEESLSSHPCFIKHQVIHTVWQHTLICEQRTESSGISQFLIYAHNEDAAEMYNNNV